MPISQLHWIFQCHLIGAIVTSAQPSAGNIGVDFNMQLIFAILVTFAGANAFNTNRRQMMPALSDVRLDDVWEPMDATAIDFEKWRAPQFLREGENDLGDAETGSVQFTTETVPLLGGETWWKVLQGFFPSWADTAASFARKMTENTGDGEPGSGSRFLSFVVDIFAPVPEVEDNYLKYKVERERQLLRQDLERYIYL